MRRARIVTPVRSIIADICLACGLLALLSLGGCATPIIHGDSDLPNFQQVSDTLYRGGQPTRKGCERLTVMGIKTIVNVRGGDNTDHDLLNGITVDCQCRPMSAWGIIDDDVVWFLRIATDPARAPVFLHCHRGSDRTGCLVAMYRVVVQGWDRQRAIAEMTADGNGFHGVFQDLITYVRTADVDRLKHLLMTSDESVASNKPVAPAAGLQGGDALVADRPAGVANQ